MVETLVTFNTLTTNCNEEWSKDVEVQHRNGDADFSEVRTVHIPLTTQKHLVGLESFAHKLFIDLKLMKQGVRH